MFTNKRFVNRVFNKINGGIDYSDIIFYWGMENVTYTTADKAGGTATGTAVANVNSSATAKVGSVSMQWTGINSYISHPFIGNMDKNVGGIGFWFRPSALVNFAGVFSANNGSDQIVVHMTAAGRWRYLYSAGGTGPDVTITTGTAMTTGNWYWVQFMWNNTTDNYNFNVWDSSDTLIQTSSSTTTAGTFGSDPSTFLFGESLGNPGTGFVDNVIVTNSFSRDLHAVRNNTSFP